MTENDIRQALDALAAANAEIGPALTNQATAENAIRCAKAELDDAKRQLSDAIVGATAAAMFGPEAVIDGKNAEARKAQLDDYLLQSQPVAQAQAQVEIAEGALLDAETMAEQLKADARAAIMRAGIAQHSAALLAAWCNLLACPASDTITVTGDL